MTKGERLAAALDEFLSTSPEIEAAAVVSADGLPMASALPPDVEEERLAAMSAALLTLGERAAEGLGKGGLAQVFVEGEHGYVVLMAAGNNAVLVTVTSRESKVGLVLYEMRRSAEKVAAIMLEAPDAPEYEPHDMPRSPVEAVLEEAMPAPPAETPPPPVESHSSISTWH